MILMSGFLIVLAKFLKQPNLNSSFYKPPTLTFMDFVSPNSDFTQEQPIEVITSHPTNANVAALHAIPAVQGDSSRKVCTLPVVTFIYAFVSNVGLIHRHSHRDEAQVGIYICRRQAIFFFSSSATVVE